jgi:hypothetical protein
LQRVAFADSALLAGGIDQIQAAADYEHVRMAIGEETRDAARTGIDIGLGWRSALLPGFQAPTALLLRRRSSA